MSTNLQSESLPFNPRQYSLEEILKPQRCALIVVDVQNDFCDPNGFFAKKLKHDTTQMQSIVPHIQQLIDTAHKAGVAVIFTKGYEDVRFRKGPDLRRAVKWEEKDGNGSVNSESGTWGAELYQLIPQEGDIVVEKNKWSAFDGKNKDDRTLKQILDQLGVRTLVVTGVVAETCVETTIRDAYDQDYFVVIPEHSVGSNNEKRLQARMQYWKAGFVGDVVDEEVVIKNWSPNIKGHQNE